MNKGGNGFSLNTMASSHRLCDSLFTPKLRHVCACYALRLMVLCVCVCVWCLTCVCVWPRRYKVSREMGEETRARLYQFFEPHNRRFFEEIGRDLDWTKPPSAPTPAPTPTPSSLSPSSSCSS
jgi:hypothetical protein